MQRGANEMAKIDQFSAPGNLKDFGGAMAARWSRFVSDDLDREVAALAQSNPGLQPQFYNPAKLDVAGTPAPISWPAFPQIIEIRFGDDQQEMFRQGEIRNDQDEYLEWAVITQNGKITKVMFTCEGPEHWTFIANHDKTLLVKLYSGIVGQAVTSSPPLFRRSPARSRITSPPDRSRRSPVRAE
jgi:hypothetical protein